MYIGKIQSVEFVGNTKTLIYDDVIKSQKHAEILTKENRLESFQLFVEDNQEKLFIAIKNYLVKEISRVKLEPSNFGFVYAYDEINAETKTVWYKLQRTSFFIRIIEDI